MKREYNNYKSTRQKERPKEEGLMVIVHNDDINKALRRLKRKVEKAGVMKEVRNRAHYIKPSEKRKLAKKAGRKRWLKIKARMELD
jgi:small subunit ribosomal protein S21